MGNEFHQQMATAAFQGLGLAQRPTVASAAAAAPAPLVQPTVGAATQPANRIAARRTPEQMTAASRGASTIAGGATGATYSARTLGGAS